MEIATGFILIGEDEDGAEDLSSAEPGRVAVIHQALYEQGEKDWDKAGRVGTLDGVVVAARRGKVVCHLVFDLEGEGTIVVAGSLPAGASHFGDGALAVGGGTGGFAKVAGTCMVETMNPKRYSFS